MWEVGRGGKKIMWGKKEKKNIRTKNLRERKKVMRLQKSILHTQWAKKSNESRKSGSTHTLLVHSVFFMTALRFFIVKFRYCSMLRLWERSHKGRFMHYLPSRDVRT